MHDDNRMQGAQPKERLKAGDLVTLLVIVGLGLIAASLLFTD